MVSIEEALIAVNEDIQALLTAVRATLRPRHVWAIAQVTEAKERKSKEYHVDLWEVGPYTRFQNGKKVRVRGYTAAPKESSLRP